MNKNVILVIALILFIGASALLLWYVYNQGSFTSIIPTQEGLIKRDEQIYIDSNRLEDTIRKNLERFRGQYFKKLISTPQFTELSDAAIVEVEPGVSGRSNPFVPPPALLPIGE